MKKDEFKYNDKGVNRIAYLIAGYVRNTLTKPEHDELDAWVEQSDRNMLLFEELTDENNLEANLAWMDEVQTEKMLRKTKAELIFSTEKKTIVHKRWLYAIAASVILFMGGVWMYTLIVQERNGYPEIVTDVLPGGNKAILTLEDGTVIDLNNVAKGVIKNENGLSINKTSEGEIVYTKTSLAGIDRTTYNILSTPRGGEYKVQLPDGSWVWLNAASSLKYPTVFNANSRTVELNGEAYFEIAKDKNKPFVVKLSDESKVNVLGTHFNIMSYDSEKTKQITLLEGSVKITLENHSLKLEPGQQAKINTGEIGLVPTPDLEEVIGWKEGEFVFHDADIQTIMRQVERWYDVEVKYEGTISQYFNATISRNVPVSRLLQILEKTDKIHFKIENKTIYVLP